MKYLILVFVFVGFVSFVPLTAYGAEPLVPCDGVTVDGVGVSCNFCHGVELVHRVTKFLVGILVIIAVILLAITGVQMAYTAAGSGDARSLLKDRLTNIVIGFFLIVASWTIIDTLLKALVSDAEIKNHWRTPIEELCGFQREPAGSGFGDPNAPLGEFQGLPTGNVSDEQMTHDEALTTLQAAGINVISTRGIVQADCAGVAGCTSLQGVNTDTVNQMIAIKQGCPTCKVDLIGATEVGPHSPTGGHTQGLKADIVSNTKLNNYLQSTLISGGVRTGDHGGPRYYDRCGNEYVYETNYNHWDIKITNGVCSF